MNWFKKLFKKKDFSIWVYGTCHNRPARKHRIHGNVQFVLWKAGEHGHKEDFWHNFEKSWWPEFIATEALKTNTHG